MKNIYKFLVVLVVMVFMISGCERMYGIEDDNSTEMPDIEDVSDDLDDDVDDDLDDVDDSDLAGDDSADDDADDDAGDSDAEIIVYEGELVNVRVNSQRDDLEFSYSEPLDEEGQWQTEEGDAGTYTLVISASDGTSTTSKSLKLLVKRRNKAPSIESIDDFTVSVGDTIIFEPEVSDPEGDDVTVSYSGWMDSNEKTVGEDDVGTHKVTIRASDGDMSDKETVKITVIEGNRAPVISGLEDIEVFEGETARLDPEVSDPDGDDVEVMFGDPFDEDGEWETGFDDEGTYEVTVTASDGEKDSEKTIEVTVVNKLSPDDLDIEIVIE